jgi:DNA helicase-2/ATP-dependent DNA helicase PcrA
MTNSAEESQEGIQLMTLHSSKGLEFEAVFIVGLEEGLFPSLRAESEEKGIEEERRLCYVGMTRAKSHLFLSHVHLRTVWGQTQVHEPSRFIEEIPEELLETSSPKKRRFEF